MRTHDEIVTFCLESGDLMGFTHEILLPYLPAEKVKRFLKKDADISDWEEAHFVQEKVIADMKSYMEFAWEKVQNHRGISASRSVKKMRAWLWLLGDDEMVAFSQVEENYPHYGAPILKKICEKYSFAIPQGNAIENMAQGKPCWYGCEEGCRS